MKKNAFIILAEGFEEIEAVTPIDLLRRADINVTIYGLSSKEIKGSHGIIIKSDKLLSSQEEIPSALIIPGGVGHKNLLNSSVVLDYIKRCYNAGSLCAAICAAPVVFAKAGILAGKKACCYPGFEDKLGGGIFVNEQVVIDGNIITGRGPGVAVLFSLEIISYLLGRNTADKVGSAILYY
jgi:4-methyl-5(b-hydroxyethyl)-thiazole monophosphate biosynthesis